MSNLQFCKRKGQEIECVVVATSFVESIKDVPLLKQLRSQQTFLGLHPSQV